MTIPSIHGTVCSIQNFRLLSRFAACVRQNSRRKADFFQKSLFFSQNLLQTDAKIGTIAVEKI